ncbi:MAG TPA: glycosyltransferase family 4 protein [Stellaceae bacterium]|nr:glycosyltransferase family 4 protein [Stellaceae bacterium]
MAEDDSIPPAAPKDRPPAVLQIVPSLVSGGAERGTVELAEALVASGWISYVASSGGPLAAAVARAGATHLTLPLAAKNPLAIRRNAWTLAQLIRRLGVDVVHARSRAPAWSARAAARATGRRFVTTFHNAYDTDLPFKRWYNSVMAKGDRVIAISDFVAAYAARVYGVGPERLRTIPRGVDLAVFDPHPIGPERLAALAHAWQLPDGVPVVMLPGRLTRWKGGLDFIAALAALREEFCGVMVGAEQRPGFRSELQAAAARAGLGARFRIVENCGDMPAAYLLAAVVVSASRDPEGFGRVAVEAQAMGRPVVATDHGGARETVAPGESGWLVPPGNPPALAAAIGRALALSPEARRRLGERARAHVALRFTREAMCARTIGVYEELLFPANGGGMMARATG